MTTRRSAPAGSREVDPGAFIGCARACTETLPRKTVQNRPGIRRIGASNRGTRPKLPTSLLKTWPPSAAFPHNSRRGKPAVDYQFRVGDVQSFTGEKPDGAGDLLHAPSGSVTKTSVGPGTVYSNFSSLRYFFCGILGFVLVVLRFDLVHSGFALMHRLLRLFGTGRLCTAVKESGKAVVEKAKEGTERPITILFMLSP